MYKVKWDKESRGILLTDKIDKREEIVPPRPVFFEELNLLGFDKYWKYPKAEEPLLWAIGRRYFYRGEWVAQAKGGNIFEEPEVVIVEKGENLRLEPVDVKLMIEKNKDALFTLENEAMDFVEHTYKIYKNKVDYFAVAFSGGKDSQVVLDIVSRVLPPDEYLVIFTDTTMELPFTYKTVEETKRMYQKLYPELELYTARHKERAVELWEKFGPPSRIHRWCCSVCKTAPFTRLIRKLYNGNGEPNILVFEGVRADESSNRSSYKRITKMVKQMMQTNAEVIQFWNFSEVFLYLFLRNIGINKAYRYGLNRIGCSICPFGSEWSEFIINKTFPNLSKRYISIIEKYTNLIGLKDEEKVKEYLSKGQWKKRAGGRGLNTDGTRIDFVEEKGNLKAVLTKSRENFLEWVKTLGDVIYKDRKDKIIGEIKVGSEIFNFEVESEDDNKKTLIRVSNIGRDIISLSKLKKVLYKSTYCIHCGACEVECPTAALRIIPQVKIDRNYCIHCGNCLNFVEKGCLMAKSVYISSGGKNMRKYKVATSRYQTFGMRKEWLSSFLNNIDNWFLSNNLGSRQVESMVAWLKDAELLEEKRKVPSKSAEILKEVFNKDESSVWEIIWVNLYYNSGVIKWYTSDIKWGTSYSSKELKDVIVDANGNIPEKTASNTIFSLMNFFDSNPLGKDLKVGLIEKEKNTRYVKKIGTDNIHPMVVAYCLYRYAEGKARYDLTVSEFYRENCDGGPYKLFGISKEKFKNILRWLQENKDKIVKVDLTAGLDNIHLRDDLAAQKIIEMLSEK